MEKRLYRSSRNKVLAGVCGGIGEYFDVDPVIIRILAVVFTLMMGTGLIAYIVAAIVIPGEKSASYQGNYRESCENGEGTESNYKVDHPEYDEKSNRKTALVLGLIFIGLGGLIVFRHFVSWIPAELIFAGILIFVGALIIFSRK